MFFVAAFFLAVFFFVVFFSSVIVFIGISSILFELFANGTGVVPGLGNSIYLLVTMGDTPLPPVYWNHRLSAKIEFNLWGSTSYGQNLEP